MKHRSRAPAQIAQDYLVSVWEPDYSKRRDDTYVLDIRGGNDLAVTGATWEKENGLWRISFDGSGDYCKIDDADQTGLDVGTDMFMFEAWVRPTTTDSNYLVQKGYRTGTPQYYSLQVVVAPSVSSFKISGDFRSGGRITWERWVMNYSDLDKWLFVGWLFGKSGSNRTVDVEIKGAAPTSKEYDYAQCLLTDSPDTDKPFFLGCGSYDGDTVNYLYTGDVGHVIMRNFGDEVPSDVWDIFERDYQATRGMYGV